MKVEIILVSLFSLSVSLGIRSIDLGKKVLFDSTNNEFIIEYDGPKNNLFLFLISHEKENLGYEIKCPLHESSSSGLKEKEYEFLFPNSDGECKFKLNIDEGDTGHFIIYDFKALYEIKLKNKYGNINVNIGYSHLKESDFDKSASKLTFLVPNFRTNSNITFEYVENVWWYSEKFENPFKVCHENVCKENVTSYYFEQGKSYQIYVKLLKVLQGSSTRYDYVVPPFRFYANDSDEEYSNDDIKYTYNETKPHSSSNYSQTSLRILVLLISLLF